MKTILSFLKPVSKGLDWIRQGLVMFWRVTNVGIFPTEKNLLLSFWYGYAHFKARKAKATVELFLDNYVVYIKRELEDTGNSSKKKQLYRDLLSALHQLRLRNMIISFLESSPPEDHYLPVLEAIKRAWRDGEPSEQPDVLLAGPESAQPYQPSEFSEPSQPSEASKEGDPAGDAPRFNAKTYFIAAELHYGLAGRQDEFQVLCRQLPELAAFVQSEFGAARLPGRFKEFKGYTYKKALKDHNAQKKGQLKPCFRQIVNNPQVFGEAIADRAREILAEHFN
jgi:hypothetical protein